MRKMVFKSIIYALFAHFSLMACAINYLAASPCMAILPWHLVGDNDRELLGREIQKSLIWALKDDYQVELLKQEEVDNNLQKLGLRSQDNWNLQRAGEFLTRADCDFLLMGKAVPSGNKISGSMVLIQRDGYNQSKLVSKEKIFAVTEHKENQRASKEKENTSGILIRDPELNIYSLRSYIKKVLNKMGPFFEMKRELIQSGEATPGFRQETDLSFDLAWLIDTSGSMGTHKQAIAQSLEQVWYDFAKSLGNLPMRFALLPYNNTKNEGKTPPRFESKKTDWQSSLRKFSFIGKGGPDALENAFNRAISGLNWSRKGNIKILIWLTDGDGLGHSYVFGRIRDALNERGIHVFCVSFPGMEHDALEKVKAITARTGGGLEHVLTVLRAFGARERVDLAHYGGKWFRFRGGKNFFDLAKARVVRLLDEDLVKQNFLSKYSDGSIKEWSYLGTYPTKRPESVIGRIGIFKNYRLDRTFAVQNDIARVPLRMLNHWLKGRFGGLHPSRLEKILLSDQEMAKWIQVPRTRRKLISRFQRELDRGYYVWISARIVPDRADPMKFSMDPSSVKLMEMLAEPPRIFTLKLGEPIRKISLLARYGLGKENLYFFQVKVRAVGSLSRKDVRDF